MKRWTFALPVSRLDFGSLKSLSISLAAFLGLTALAPGAAVAQNDPADFCRNGQIAVLRISKIIETGSRSGFDQAMADQLAWYRSHGFTTNRLVTANVIVQDPKTKVWSKSATEVLSLHINPPPMAAIKPDAAWTAFVSEFRSSSIVESERTACLEQPLN